MRSVKRIDKKIKHEKTVVKNMITIYCNKNHSRDGILCEDCKELIAYSNTKVEKCPHMETKTFCSSCQTQCYDEEHRHRIKDVMRFSGPRAILYHPVTTIKYIMSSNLVIVNILFILLGFLSIGLGILGIILPVLPTTPFLLLGSYLLMKGSPKLDKWFKSTQLYEKRLKEFDENRSMSLKSKIILSILSSTMLLIAFIKLPILLLRIFIVFVDIFKYYFFIFKIGTREIKGVN